MAFSIPIISLTKFVLLQLIWFTHSEWKKKMHNICTRYKLSDNKNVRFSVWLWYVHIEFKDVFWFFLQATNSYVDASDDVNNDTLKRWKSIKLTFFRCKMNETSQQIHHWRYFVTENPQMPTYLRRKINEEKRTKEWFENSLDQIEIRCLHFGRFYWITMLELWFIFSLLLRRCSVCIAVVYLFCCCSLSEEFLFSSIDVMNIRCIPSLFWALIQWFHALHTKSNVNKYNWVQLIEMDARVYWCACFNPNKQLDCIVIH